MIVHLLIVLSTGCCALQSVEGNQRPQEQIEECGYDFVHEDCEDRIDLQVKGGNTANSNEYPFLVSLQKKRQGGSCYEHFCGGSMLAPNLVLTAAHCFQSLRLESNNQPGQTIYIANHPQCRHQNDPSRDRLPVDRIFIHPNYDTASYNADIALLTLLKKYDGPTIEIDFNPAQLEVGAQMQVVGYGFTRVEEEENSLYAVYPLQEAAVFMATESTCRELMNATKNCQQFLNYTSMVCSLGKGTDTDDGDSGGPVIKQKDGSWKQVAIISWGPARHCRAQVNMDVDVFVRLATFKEWIIQTIDKYARPLPKWIPEPPISSNPTSQFPISSFLALSPLPNDLQPTRQFPPPPSARVSRQELSQEEALDVFSKAAGFSGSVCTDWTDGHCYMIYLSEQGLSGTLAPELSVLTDLRSFQVLDSQMQGTLPPHYSRWVNLEYISFRHNEFSGTLPPHYSSWQNLKDAYFQHNLLTGTLPPIYSNWQNVKVAFFSRNQLTGTLPPHYSNWQNLEHASFSRNQLTGSLPPQYSRWVDGALVELSELNLTGRIPIEYTSLELN